VIDERAFEEIVRSESGRVVGALVARCGDLDLAQDAFSDAVLAAWETWPRDGVPERPGAWLTTVARNRLIDRVRREAQRPARELASVRESTSDPARDPEFVGDDLDRELAELVRDPLDDDELRLVFLCCHPALSQDAQVALTLRSVGGLTTPEIARSFLVPEATMAQRLVRARRKIAVAGIPFRVPDEAELPSRVAAALHVVYLVFTEGWNATGTDDVVRADLCAEALRLARLLHRLLPTDSEVSGLLALLLLHDARRDGRVDADGGLLLLAEQPRARWNGAQVAEGVALIEAALPVGPVGPYQVQAAIAALHAEAPTPDDTDWPQVLALYDVLVRLDPSPLVRLNRAVAVAEVEGAGPALSLVDALAAEPALRDNHRVRATRAHLLVRLDRPREAAEEFAGAADLCASPAEQRYLRARAADLTA